MKKLKIKIASLLRRWAQKLHPENRTLPEGYEVAKIEATHTYTNQEPCQ